MEKKNKNARVMMIVSMTVFGTLGLFVRNIPLSSGELALYRAVLALILIGFNLLVTKQKIPLAAIRKDLPLLLLSILVRLLLPHTRDSPWTDERLDNHILSYQSALRQ